MAEAGALTFQVSYNKHLVKIVDRFAKAYPELIEKAVRQTTDWAKRKIIELTPVKTGAARASFTVEQNPEPFSYSVVSTIGRGAKYTPMLERGTGLWGESGQPITPKKGEWLVFPIIEGNTIVRWVKTKSVRGMMGHFMVARTRRDAGPYLTKKLRKLIQAEWGKR